MAELGFDVMQVYGLTETYGHVVHCAWQPEWDDLPFAEQAEIKARQGVRFPITEDVRAARPRDRHRHRPPTASRWARS